eukprot:TRINITY_DN6447_c0_g1_i1.p1 TRINITY_DN6447_c0_g1~~TRINITY_DN6447_c0_g1_i1.p1  ORF type:complete len:264 (-),score=59.79 TRINITY_DN6447_c0_g1_i1:113-904(-)
MRITDYSAESLTDLLQDVDVLFSLIHDDTEWYTNTHLAMIEACKRSPRCKRFVPSEYGGDIEKFPDQPLFDVPTHGAVRKALRSQSEIEFTLFNLGWFMDYFLPSKNTYMKSIFSVWPIDMDERKASICGTGNEMCTFTSARDVGKALAQLIDAEKWEEFTYVMGDNLTWNQAIELVQDLNGIKLDVSYRPLEEIQQTIQDHKDDEDLDILWSAYLDLWNAIGAVAVPIEKASRQRQQYFSRVHFRTIRELVSAARNEPFAKI